MIVFFLVIQLLIHIYLTTFPFCVSLFLQKPTAVKHEITFRRLRNIDLLFFNHNLSQGLVTAVDVLQVNETLLAKVNSALEFLLDKHAPVTKHKFTVSPKQPLFSLSIVLKGKSAML